MALPSPFHSAALQNLCFLAILIAQENIFFKTTVGTKSTNSWGLSTSQPRN